MGKDLTFFILDTGTLANSEDTDQSLHCLQSSATELHVLRKF